MICISWMHHSSVLFQSLRSLCAHVVWIDLCGMHTVQQITSPRFCPGHQSACSSPQSIQTWPCISVQVKFLTDEQAVLVEDRAKAAAEAAKVGEQLAERHKEGIRLGAELAAAQNHSQKLDSSLRAMTAEKVYTFLAAVCLAFFEKTPRLGHT